MNISIYWFIQGLVVLSTVQTQTYLGWDSVQSTAMHLNILLLYVSAHKCEGSAAPEKVGTAVLRTDKWQ
jgi:hypothetical protein